MFNVGMTELLLILVIAFVVVGPKDLPKVARALGRFVRTLRELAEELLRLYRLRRRLRAHPEIFYTILLFALQFGTLRA